MLTACLIIRDSEHLLPDCLGSIAPWVEELIVVDTGSKDHSPQVAEKLGAKVFHFPWCDDFAVARNESLRHASGDWIFWMDADDTIDAANGQKLQALARGSYDERLMGFVMQVHCPAADEFGGVQTTVVDHLKLFRNHPEIRFEGRIHEQVLPSIRRLGGEVARSDVFVVHSGACYPRQLCNAVRSNQKDTSDIKRIAAGLTPLGGRAQTTSICSLPKQGVSYVKASSHPPQAE